MWVILWSRRGFRPVVLRIRTWPERPRRSVEETGRRAFPGGGEILVRHAFFCRIPPMHYPKLPGAADRRHQGQPRFRHDRQPERSDAIKLSSASRPTGPCARRLCARRARRKFPRLRNPARLTGIPARLTESCDVRRRTRPSLSAAVRAKRDANVRDGSAEPRLAVTIPAAASDACAGHQFRHRVPDPLRSRADVPVAHVNVANGRSHAGVTSSR